MRTLRAALLACMVVPVAAHSQGLTLTPTQSRPAIRQLGAIIGTSTDSLVGIANVRVLPGGRLLINDVASRRVVMVDSTFKTLSVVADSTSSTANAYGPRSGSLIAYRGDSTLFVDAASLSMLVLDPVGKITRVMSVPRSQDAMMLAAGGLGAGAYYSEGHLVYRGMPGVRMQMGAGGIPTSPSVADTMAIVRVNLATRVVDTAGFIKIPKTNTNISRGDDGKINIMIEVNPLPVVDEWAVTSTGQIAMIRGRDYHVDWMSPDGTHRSSPKIPFDWKRLDDDEKVAFIDSVKAIRERQAAANPDGGNQMAQAFGAVFGGSGAGMASAMGAGGLGGGGAVMRFETRGGAGGGGPTGGMPQIAPPVITYVSPSQLTDYQPPFFATAAIADAEGNVWMRTINTKPMAGGPVYDVINAKGEVLERVQIPQGRTIIGFGAGGAVIMTHLEGTISRLEWATVR